MIQEFGAEHAYDNHFEPLEPTERDYLLHFSPSGCLARVGRAGSGEVFELPRLADYPRRPGRATYLFSLGEERFFLALDDCAGDYDVCIVDCSPTMKRLAFNAYLAAAGDGMVIVPVKLDSTVMRGTALTVSAIESISDALRVPTPAWRILRTCVPGLMTNAEATGADVLDAYFPDNQFATVIHASSKVCEGSWQWQPVAAFKPNSRPAKDYEALAEEVLHG